MNLQSKFAYLAGFIDGEGSFSITKTYSKQIKPYSKKVKKEDKVSVKYVCYKLDVSVTNTNKEVMDWIAFTFGGKVYSGGNTNRNPKYKPRHTWHVSNREACKVLITSILPYLIVKKEQAKTALGFIDTYRTSIGNLTEPAVVLEKEALRIKMRTLNGTLHRDFISERNCTIPAETTRESLLIEDDDIVRPSQRCEEVGRNDQSETPLV